MQHLTHVWVLNEAARSAPSLVDYRDDPRVRFVDYGSPGYYQAMARSQYLVNNATFPPEFGRRAGQVYLNTWHGVP
jgi:CDP-glycerol glycerophosphotransferase (TagB/SpsB family)